MPGATGVVFTSFLIRTGEYYTALLGRRGEDGLGAAIRGLRDAGRSAPALGRRALPGEHRLALALAERALVARSGLRRRLVPRHLGVAHFRAARALEACTEGGRRRVVARRRVAEEDLAERELVGVDACARRVGAARRRDVMSAPRRRCPDRRRRRVGAAATMRRPGRGGAAAVSRSVRVVRASQNARIVPSAIERAAKHPSALGRIGCHSGGAPLACLGFAWSAGFGGGASDSFDVE